MLTIRRTRLFCSWLADLRDPRARIRIDIRVDRLAKGNAGDCKSVGEGVSELKVDYGPGYRVYFIKRGPEIIVLLCGGDKSTQTKDIVRARTLAREWENEDGA